MTATRSALPLVLALALAATARAETITLFDGGAGTLPQAQPWLAYIGSVAPTVAPDGVALDTRATADTLAGFFNHQLLALPKTWLIKNPAFPQLDPAEGFTLSFWLALPDETHLNSNRAGFSVIVIGSDQRGIELGMWENRIWAQGGSSFTQAEGVGFDTTARTLYALSIFGSTYTLRANGTPVLTGLTRDYTAANPFVDPYEQPNMVFLGDDTTSASASIVLGSVWLEQGPPPPDGTGLAAFKLSSSVVAGCKNVTGSVTLSAPAPLSGTVVTLSDSLAHAETPAGVIVPAGATSKSFSIRTTAVAANESGTVSATLGPATLSQALTLRPIGLSSVSLTPTSVTGGYPVTGKATLECAAAPGAIEVALSSGNPSAASPTAASVFVSQGTASATFDVATDAVLARTTATISGTASGITKSKVLTLNTAASVSPTSLKFPNQVVGTTSAPLSATLTNKGAESFAVDGIGITGAYAAWFAQTSNCPTTLAAGASCTISVTFSPLAAASRSAKLVIATSATSTPLGVSLSGTGT